MRQIKENKLSFLAEGATGASHLPKFPKPGRSVDKSVGMGDQPSEEPEISTPTANSHPNEEQLPTPIEQSFHASEVKVRIRNIHFPEITQRQNYRQADILSMMETIRKTNGVINKMVIRPYPGRPDHYFIIEGGTRLKALSTMYGEDYEESCVVKDVNQNEGFWLGYTLNEERNPLTDYDKGISFAAMIESKEETFDSICVKAKISKTTLSFLLCYTKLPLELREFIAENKSKVPANIAYHLKRLCEHCGESVASKTVQKIVSESWVQSKVKAYVDKKVGENSTQQRRKRRQSITFGDFGHAKTSDHDLELKLENLTQEQIEAIVKSVNACLQPSITTAVDTSAD